MSRTRLASVAAGVRRAAAPRQSTGQQHRFVTTVLGLALAAGCGTVNDRNGGELHDAGEPAADAPAADAPAEPDAAPVDDCVRDRFEGSALASHWVLLAGDMPTYDVGESRLLITDAPFAEAPSKPTYSWIYDLDVDKGNQLGWAQAIGEGDFSVTADLQWSSSDRELTLAGIGVADGQGTIAGLVGVRDGSTSLVGQPTAQILVADGDDAMYLGSRTEPGSASVRLERRAGTLRAYVDDAEILSASAERLISYVTIFYVRRRNDAIEFAFGSVELRNLEICRL